MTTIRKWVRFVFGFSGTETNGFLILLPLLFIILFSQPVYRAIKASSDTPFAEADKLLLDSIVLAFEKNKNDKPASNESRIEIERHLAMFDPNTASDKALMRVGFNEKISKRIINYRSKGGKFIVKRDLLKVFGMDTLLYKELYAYIDLPETKVSKYETAAPSNSTVAPVRRVEKFDLNLADTAELKTVYGVGSKRARRIVAFREKLGGFIHASQLREVYGLDSSAVEQLLKKTFVADNFLPFRLNINKANDNELSAHPYISPVIAKAIVAYRFQHGNFASVDEIRAIQNLKKEDADKIIPYLDVNP
jgi:competence protein ComEA